MIGLEYRFGLFKGAQVGIHRTSIDKDIEFFGAVRRPEPARRIAARDCGLGEHRRHEQLQGQLLARHRRAALARVRRARLRSTLEPLWVNNSNPLPDELVDDNNTFIIGLGARVRIRPSVYLLVEGAPRVTGYDPGVTHVSFGIEKRAGGHMFQLNFSNSFATTLAQIARGGFNNDDWYLGFNLSRKFF